jgi:hypothetical protein
MYYRLHLETMYAKRRDAAGGHAHTTYADGAITDHSKLGCPGDTHARTISTPLLPLQRATERKGPVRRGRGAGLQKHLCNSTDTDRSPPPAARHTAHLTALRPRRWAGGGGSRFPAVGPDVLRGLCARRCTWVNEGLLGASVVGVPDIRGRPLSSEDQTAPPHTASTQLR